jgi:hypothetical protein
MKFYNPFKWHIIKINSKFYIRSYVFDSFVVYPVYLHNNHHINDRGYLSFLDNNDNDRWDGRGFLFSKTYQWRRISMFNSFDTINEAKVKLDKQSKKVKVHV